MPERISVLVLSSQAKNTGSTLRAFYIQKYLRHSTSVDYIEPPFKSMPLMLDFLFSMFYYFFALMNRRRYDFVVIVKPYPNTVLPVLMLLKPQGTKIITDVDDLDHGYRGGFLSGIIAVIQSKLLEMSDFVTSHNKELMVLIEKQHPKFAGSVYMLKQCVDHEVFVKKPALKALSERIKKEHEGKKILFYTAHLNIACYLEAILKSFAPISCKKVLIVAGGGPMLQYYKKLTEKMNLSSCVIFTGEIERGRIAAYIKAADLCLVYYEDKQVNRCRASMKLREYLALAANVVANGVGEIKDFRQYIYMSGASESSFASMLRKTVAVKLRENDRASAFIKKEYDWGKEAKRFFDWMKKQNGGTNK